MLEVEGLTVSYGAVDAVAGIDLTVGDGEAVSLLGPNGAGKTSTLRAISGLTAHRGNVRFDGVDLRGRSPEQIARMGLVHVPEGRHVFPTLTVHENLQMGLSARNGRPADYGVDEVYDLFPALPKLKRRAGWVLSGGEQQMVAIGRALTAAPRLLLLDEPSLGLAPAVVHTMFEALQVIRSQTAMLVVEQNTGMALGLCPRAYVLVGGSIVVSETSDGLRDRQTLLDSFLGRRDIELSS